MIPVSCRNWKMNNKKNRIVLATLAGIILIFLTTLVQGSWNGKELFKKEGCLNCHSFRGQGGSLGPDLTALSSRRGTLWSMEQIKDPKKHNPESMMPEYGHLSIIELFAITLYLKT